MSKILKEYLPYLITIVLTGCTCHPYHEEYEVPNYITLNFDRIIDKEQLVVLGYGKVGSDVVLYKHVFGADSIFSDSTLTIKMNTKEGASGDGCFAGGPWTQTIEDSKVLELTFSANSIPDLSAPPHKRFFPIDFDNSEYLITRIQTKDLIKKNDSTFVWPGKIQVNF